MGPLRTDISLKRSLIARVALFVLPTVALVVGVHWVIETRLLKAVFFDALTERAKTLAVLVTANDGSFRLEFADEFMPEYSRGAKLHYFQIWLPDGSELERSISLRGDELPQRFGTLDEPAVYAAKLSNGGEVHCVGVQFPIRQGSGAPAGTASTISIVVGADGALMRESLRRGALEVLSTAGVSALAIAMMSVFALFHGVRVVERVSAQVDQVELGWQGGVDENAVPREIRPIVASLNRALAEVRFHVARERRFNADVAHELRTPIAELLATADIAAGWPDEASHARLVRHAKAIALQMSSLVESLLELSRLESGAAQGRFEEFDLAKTVRLQADLVGREYNNGHTLHVTGSEPVRLNSHPALWEVICRNLLSNALEYSPNGTVVEVKIAAYGEGARLEVSNVSQHDLTSEQLESCRKHLWRADYSGRGGYHCGLGLSLVEAASDQVGHSLCISFADGTFTATVAPTPRSTGYVRG